MFKDYKKYLSTSLQVYLFVLIIIFILKIVGLDYFGIKIDNSILNKLDSLVSNNWIGDIINYITLFIQLYFYLCLVCKKTKLFLWSFIGTSLNFVVQLIIYNYSQFDWIYYLFSFSIMLIVPMIILKRITIKNQIKYLIIISIYQIISLFIRNVGINNNYKNFLIDFVLNLDQLILLAITYEISKKKGDLDSCIQEQEVGYSSLRKINLKKLLQKLQKNFQNNIEGFKKQTKQEKLTIIIFTILSLIWNILTVVIVLFIAKINDTFVECIFILTSFWLSKRAFGKAFHFDSMIMCFIVSNLSYFVLNRMTTPLGISIFVPILLGVGLSYVTSKFVKRTYKPLYRGMSKELFEETILQVTEKGSDKYNICYEFYIEKKSDLSLSYKYNYSVSGIRKIKDRINEKIKRL